MKAFKLTAVCLLGLLLLPFCMALNKSLSHYWVRELSYWHIAERVEGAVQTQQEMIELTTGFFFINEIDPIQPFTIIDHTVHTDLIRGLGRCDQRVNGLITVLDKLDIDGRFLIFDCHTVAEIYLGSDTLVVDPTENVIWQRVTNDNDSEAFRFEEKSWVSSTFGLEVVHDYRYGHASTCSSARRSALLRERKSVSKKMLAMLISIYTHFVPKYTSLLVTWMDVLGQLEEDKMYGQILPQEERSLTLDRKARIHELLGLVDCTSNLPCFWSLDVNVLSPVSTKVLFKARIEKQKRLTQKQEMLFAN